MYRVSGDELNVTVNLSNLIMFTQCLESYEERKKMPESTKNNAAVRHQGIFEVSLMCRKESYHYRLERNEVTLL